jgi:hypothetical protein
MFGDFDLFLDFEVFFTVFDVGLFAIIFFCFFTVDLDFIGPHIN